MLYSNAGLIKLDFTVIGNIPTAGYTLIKLKHSIHSSLDVEKVLPKQVTRLLSTVLLSHFSSPYTHL